MMSTQNETDGFKLTYAAKEQEEIRKIRQKYQPQEEDNMSRLRKLDASVTQKATVVSLVIGIIGALVMGSGMSLIMTDFGKVFSLQGSTEMIMGIIMSVLGMAMACFAYPIYSKIVKREREKIAPEILRLTDELMK